MMRAKKSVRLWIAFGVVGVLGAMAVAGSALAAAPPGASGAPKSQLPDLRAGGGWYVGPGSSLKFRPPKGGHERPQPQLRTPTRAMLEAMARARPVDTRFLRGPRPSHTGFGLPPGFRLREAKDKWVSTPPSSIVFRARAQPSRAPMGHGNAPLPIESNGFYRHQIVGRLWTLKPDGSWTRCTATVVAVNVVMTAAHCLYFAGSGYGTQVWFYPSKWGAEEPYGAWQGYRWRVHTEYESGHFLPLDYGFVKLFTGGTSNTDVGSVVGWAGITVNTVGSNIWSLGYPAVGYWAQWGGQYPYFVYSPWQSYAYHAYNAFGRTWYDITIGNYMNGGSSGGPWFTYRNGHWNNVNSVNSTCYWLVDARTNCEPYGDSMSGPYLTTSTLDLFKFVGGL